MIIWIDGPYGVGKSTVAKALTCALPTDSIYLDSDEYYVKGLKQNQYFSGGAFPQNNQRFLIDFKELVKENARIHSVCVVAMALTMDESINDLFIPLSKGENDIYHIVLYASLETITTRINTQRDRENKDYAKKQVLKSISFIKKNFFDCYWINTENGNVSDIVNQVKAIGFCENP